MLNDVDLEMTGIKGNIIVGHNVRIERDTIVYPGITIGNDVIVLPGSVVTKSIPNDVIVGGNPASILTRNREN